MPYSADKVIWPLNNWGQINSLSHDSVAYMKVFIKTYIDETNDDFELSFQTMTTKHLS